MIDEKGFEKFIQILTEADNTLALSDRAFAAIAETYRLGKVILQFTAPVTIYTKDGDRKEDILFQAKDKTEEVPDYCKEFITGEGGSVVYLLYRVYGTAPFSEEEKGSLELILDVFFLHSGRWRLINQVRKLALTDSLTGLPNSGGFLTYVDTLLQKGELTKYNSYYFNLTRFSLINKRFGVKEADTIIARYAGELKKFLVEGECAGRLGGDNFVALILKERTEDFLQFISGVETYGMMGNQKVPLTISAVAGVYAIDESVTNCGMTLGESAMALNIAKHIAKKPYVFASEEIRKRVIKEKQIASGFEEAIQKREYKAYYQPKVCIDTYEIVGAEALVRWEHEGKLVPPMEFIPILEQNGMVCELDFYVLEQVCMDIREWLAKGMEPVRISVNLSRKHLADPHLSENIMQILNKYQLESKYIEVELTETVDEAETDLLINFRKKMKEHHIAMSIDDFGTGYSSLNMLRSFPVDVLKLDKTFIDSMGENDRIVLLNIIRMASELHMEVVAEGVETKQQMDYLREMECKIVQGFLFDQPMPKEAFEEKLKIGKYEMKPAI